MAALEVITTHHCGSQDVARFSFTKSFQITGFCIWLTVQGPLNLNVWTLKSETMWWYNLTHFWFYTAIFFLLFALKSMLKTIFGTWAYSMVFDFEKVVKKHCSKLKILSPLSRHVLQRQHINRSINHNL